MLQISTKRIHYGFLVVPDFSLMTYASAIEMLRMVNQVNERVLYTWDVLTPNNQPILASCGLEIAPSKNKEEMANYSALFVSGGINIRRAWNPKLATWLRQIAKSRVALAGLSTGPYLLAKSGLLDGYRSTVHWDSLSSMREEFPHLKLTDDVYEIDRDRYTCAGGASTMDFMLHLIGLEYGKATARSVSDLFLLERIRTETDRQRIPLRHQIGTGQPKLYSAVVLMEANLEEPLTTEELAGYVNITRRQLERLFRRHLKCTPMEYYRSIRLANAQRLLRHTEMPVLEVAMVCGFNSASHFSRCYKEAHNRTPGADRQISMN